MYEDLIRRALVHEVIDEIRPLGEGMDSVALIVNDAIVVRIGKTAGEQPAFAREVAMLPLLRPLIDIEIPNFSLTGQDTETGLSYVAYPVIAGQDLKPDTFREMDEAVQDGILDQVAGFLTAVNGMSLSDAHSCGIEEYDFDSGYRDLLERVEYRIYPQMGVDGQGYIEQIFDRFANRNPDLDREPALLHADLSSEHMILDEDAKVLKGIIDFGDLCIGDPDYEYHWLYEGFGRDFVTRLASRMSCKVHRQFWEKQQAFVAANVLEDVLLLEKTNYKAYRRALETINRGDFSAVYDL